MKLTDGEIWEYVEGILAQPHSERYYRRKDGMIKLVQTYYNGFEFGKQTVKYYHEDNPSVRAKTPEEV